MRIAVIHGQKVIEHDDDADGRNSPPPMIEQEPEEPAVYIVPAGVRRQRNDSSKFLEYFNIVYSIKYSRASDIILVLWDVDLYKS